MKMWYYCNCNNSVLFCFIILLFSAGAFSATITGTVKDKKENPLHTAEVVIEETGKRVFTNSRGYFRLTNVNPGEYTLQVSYSGYEPVEKTLSVTGDKTSTEEFVLMPGAHQIEKMTVYGGLARGQAEAVQRQMKAENISHVVSKEVLDKFPDKTAAESVQRLPGVTIDRDQGEGQFISVRGAGPRNTAVTVNGGKVPAPTAGDGRAVGMDLMQLNNVEYVEVSKALTPAMDADGVGGKVNLELKKPPMQRRISLKAGGGYNNRESILEDYWGREMIDVAGFYGDRFMEDRIGVIVTGSYFKTNRGSIMNEMEYEFKQSKFDSSDIGFFEFEDASDLTSRNRWNNYDVKRERYSALVGTEYRLSEDHIWNLKYNFSRYLDNEMRRRRQYYSDKTSNNDQKRLRNRLEDQMLHYGEFAGEHNLDLGNLDYKISLVQVSEDEPNQTYFYYYRTNPTILIADTNSLTNEEFREIDLTYQAPSSVPDYKFNRVRGSEHFNVDRNITGEVNFSLPYNLFNSNDVVTSGLKGKQKKRTAEETKWQAKPDDLDNGMPADSMLGDNKNTWHYLDLHHTEDEFKDIFAGMKTSDNAEQSLGSNYEAEEIVAAGYAMTKNQWVKRFSTLAGFRVEYTRNNYTSKGTQLPSQAVLNQIPGGLKKTHEGSYTTVTPSFHCNYRPDDQTNIRLAFSSAIARPDYSALIPITGWDVETDGNGDITEASVSFGDPDLKPMKSYNIDLMFEANPKPYGLVSCGIFAKHLIDAKGTKAWTQSNGGVDYAFSKPINAEEPGTIAGVELALQQNLSVLDVSLLKDFGLYSNYTYTHSEVNYGGDIGWAPLMGTAKTVVNAGLFYNNQKSGTAFNIGSNYRSPVLLSLNGNAHSNKWFNEEFHLDVSISQEVYKGLSVYANLNNLTAQQELEVKGDPKFNMEETALAHQSEKYGAFYTFGLKYDFE